MAVYIDKMRPVRVVVGHRTYRTACHMMADTPEELAEIAATIGMKPEGQHNDHFDLLSQRKRQLALDAGAIPVTSARLVELRRKRRQLAK